MTDPWIVQYPFVAAHLQREDDELLFQPEDEDILPQRSGQDIAWLVHQIDETFWQLQQDTRTHQWSVVVQRRNDFVRHLLLGPPEQPVDSLDFFALFVVPAVAQLESQDRSRAPGASAPAQWRPPHIDLSGFSLPGLPQGAARRMDADNRGVTSHP